MAPGRLKSRIKSDVQSAAGEANFDKLSLNGNAMDVSRYNLRI